MIPISGLPLYGLTQFRELREQKSVAPVPPVNPVERKDPHAHGFERESQPAAHVSISPEARALAELAQQRAVEADEG